jgi:hypothetical protein
MTPTDLYQRRRSAKPIAGGLEMEDEMRLSRSINVKGALACGVLLTTLTLAAPSFAAEAANDMPVSRHVTSHYRSIDPRTTALAPAATGPFWTGFFGSYVPAPRKPETDGLSRNPDDCVRYGCIDNGGG